MLSSYGGNIIWWNNEPTFKQCIAYLLDFEEWKRTRKPNKCLP